MLIFIIVMRIHDQNITKQYKIFLNEIKNIFFKIIFSEAVYKFEKVVNFDGEGKKRVRCKKAHHENNCIFGRDMTWRRLHFKREDDWSEIRYAGRGDF